MRKAGPKNALGVPVSFQVVAILLLGMLLAVAAALAVAGWLGGST